MNIKINLVQDWHEMVLEEVDRLKSEGFKFDTFQHWKKTRIDEIEERLGRMQAGANYNLMKKQLSKHELKKSFNLHLMFSYLNLCHRMIPTKSRKIQYAKGFTCPDKLKEGLEYLSENILNGESLFPHLSRYIFKANFKDGMLYDWGIQHLHLGTEPDKKNSLLIQGNKEVVYAMFDDENAYLICVGDHSNWADTRFLKIVKDNFPHLLEPFRSRELISNRDGWTEEERVQLRKAGATMMTTIDGDTYWPLGGGVVSSGDSLNALDRGRSTYYFYEQAERVIRSEVLKYMEPKPEAKRSHFSNLKLKMKALEKGSINVTDFDKKLNVKLCYDESPLLFTKTAITEF